MIYKYDIQNRIILKGIYKNAESLSQTQLQSFLETENNYDAVLKLLNSKITNNVYTTSDQIAKLDLLQLNYFDNYNNADQFVPDIFSQSNTNVTLSKTKETYGLITESASRLYDGDILTDNWEQKTIYYDKKARPIQIHSINATGGNDTTSVNYDFTGRVIASISSVKNAAAGNVDERNIKLSQHFIYNKNNLESIFQKFDKDPYYRRVTQLEYDDFGRVKKETLGAVEQRDYKYNMVGKLLSINNDYYEGLHNNNFFGEKINYNFSNNKSYMPHELLWRQKGSEHTQRRYSYSYDHLKRLTAAYYHQSEDGINWTKNQEDYSLLDVTYDLNGNMLSMKQWGTSAAFNNPFLMDDLSYGYKNNGLSNQLDYVTDMVTTDFGMGEFTEPSQGNSKDYNYKNGNVINDANREIGRMDYGIFSKPTSVEFANGNKIQFNYGADYQLKSKVIDDQENGIIKQIDYINGIEYIDHQLSQIPIANGSARLVSIVNNNADVIKCYEYDYHIKDHFGNVKSVVTESPDQNWYQYTNNNYVPVAFQQTSLGLGFTRQDKQYLATFENGNAVLENALFDKIDSVRDNKLNSSDPNDQSAARLNANYNTIGALKLIRVLSGDVVNVESQYFFDSNNSYYNNGTLSDHNVLNMVFQSLTGGGTSIFTENTATNIFNNINVNHWNEAFTSIAVQDNHDGAHPAAFVNLLFFDEKMQLKQSLSRRMQVNNPDNWNDLQGALEITQNGYILAFVSNQSNGDVYFDNFNITHQKGALLQESHYYPYGLTITTAPYTIVDENRNLFLGKQLEQKEFGNKGLNLYNFDYRMYDPQIGRFHASDPLAALAPSWSPYRYGFNNPVVFSDPSGLYEDYDYDYNDRDDDPYDGVNFRGSDEGNRFDIAEWISNGMDALSAMGDWIIDQTGTGPLDDYDQLSTNEDGYYEANSEGMLETTFEYHESENDPQEDRKARYGKDYVYPYNAIRATTPTTNIGKNITLVSFSDLRRWYPNKNEDKIVGYENECAIKMSYLLNLTGTDISSMPDKKTTSNGYMKMASDFAVWMKNNYGDPIAGSDVSNYENTKVLTPQEFYKNHLYEQGIIYFEFTYDTFGSGHVDIWGFPLHTGSPGGSRYLYQATQGGRAMKIWFWPLK